MAAQEQLRLGSAMRSSRWAMSASIHLSLTGGPLRLFANLLARAAWLSLIMSLRPRLVSSSISSITRGWSLVLLEWWPTNRRRLGVGWGPSCRNLLDSSINCSLTSKSSLSVLSSISERACFRVVPSSWERERERERERDDEEPLVEPGLPLPAAAIARPPAF